LELPKSTEKKTNEKKSNKKKKKTAKQKKEEELGIEDDFDIEKFLIK